MAFRASSILRLQRPATTRALNVSIASRTFSTAPQLRLKEDRIRSPEEAEATKQSQLQKQKEGKGHWHEELASNSESNVKADQEHGKVGDHKKHMEDLQKDGKAKRDNGEL